MAAKHNLQQITDQNFETAVGKAEHPVLVDFWATWCAPCKMLKPVLEELATEYDGRVQLAELDVDANPNTASRFGVLSIPTLILFRSGKPAQRIVGYQPKANLRQKIDAVL
ncbi:MAG TPA: thioredoxin [Candidatus Limnocylindrales bacterium]|nr:thioredoxin [Candidatus Limnocylindrales bacterium]